MQITEKAWNNYIKKLSAVCNEAGAKMKAFVAKYGLSNQDALLRYAMRLVQQYGEGSAALACEMYDEIAALSGADVPPAEPAEVASQHEVAKGVIGSLKQSPSGNLIDTVVNRLVKRTGADTTLKNAVRDQCEFAWIPSGDTCSFCFMLASAGWRKAGPKTLSGDHAEHVHAHCDCQYCVRFDSKTEIKGHNPKALKAEWDSLTGKTSKEKRRAYRQKMELKKRQDEFIIELEGNSSEVFKKQAPGGLKENLEKMGFDVKPLGRGGLKGVTFEEGGGYKTDYGGNGYIQYHPSEGSHHDGAYYKISNAKQGKRWFRLNGDEFDGRKRGRKEI